MTKILLIRHGETEVTDRLSGRSPDVFLSKTGIEQVEKLSENLNSFRIDKLISSPIERTKQTAEIISEKLHLNFEIDEQFIEIDFGEWTNKKWSELKPLEEWKNYNTFRSGTRIPGGELISEVQNRMITGINKIAADYPDKTVALVSHGDPIKSALMYYLGIPLDFILRIKIDYASLSIISVEKSYCYIKCINQIFSNSYLLKS